MILLAGKIMENSLFPEENSITVNDVSFLFFFKKVINLAHLFI